MPREIKTTIAVDGEQAFKRAINEANTSMRNLGTQLTLAQAQFKKDGDAMKLMESRSKTLTAEIGQQENIVKALEKAVEDSSKAYGENSEKTEKWEAELNRAKAKLANLQSELTLNEQGLDRNGKAFDESSQAAAEYQATLQTIGKNVSFQSVTEGIGGITSKIEGAITKLFSFAKAIRETFADAGEWADTLMTDATKYDMDVETLQRWQNAADFIDTDVSTIITARDKLGKKMKDGWKDGDLDMWQVLGIDLKDAETGRWRDKMDVMWEVGEALMSMARIDGDDVRADAYAQEVFGKSWRELLPLFRAGREEWEKMVAEQQVVSEERVKALGELDDANQALANSWDVTKYSFLAELAPLITDVTEAVTEMLKAFNEWMDTDEGKQAMDDLSEAIRSLFSGLQNIDFKDAIDKVKDAIDGIVKAFQWIDQHKGEIVHALEIIGEAFIGMQLMQFAVNLASIVTNLGILKGGNDTQAAAQTPGVVALPGVDATAQGVLTGWSGSKLLNFMGPLAAVTAWDQAVNAPLRDGWKAKRAELEQRSKETGMSAADLLAADTLEMTPEQYAQWKSEGERIGTSGGRAFTPAAPVYEGGTFGREGLFGGRLNDLLASDGIGKNSLTSDDISEFRGLPAMITAVAKQGIESANIQVVIQDENGKYWTQELYKQKQQEDEKTTFDTPDLEGVLREDKDILSDAVAQIKTTVESGKTVAQTVAGMDIKRFNGLPAELLIAAQRGTAAGVSGIRVYLDGATVGRLVAPYVNATLGSMAV